MEDNAIAEDDALDVVLHAETDAQHEQVEQIGEEHTVAVRVRYAAQGAELLGPLAHNFTGARERLQDPVGLLLDADRLLADLAVLAEVEGRLIRNL